MKRYIWVLGLPFIMAQSPIPSSFPIKFQARFSPLATNVAKARLVESNKTIIPDLMDASSCGPDRCAIFSILASPGQTLRFKIIVSNAIGTEVASNEATFSVPAPPSAPTLSVQTIP